MIDFSRRAMIAGAAAAPLAFASAGTAQSLEDKCRDALRPTMDFPQLGKYRDDNARLLASGAPVRVVFMGDSITEGWKDKDPDFFRGGRVDRGISGQTTPQMVLRMMADVVALRPAAVHILAGTNDIAGNTGPMTPRMTEDNFRMMSDIARMHRIKVLIGAIPPAARFPWRPDVDPRARIAELNRWLKQFARVTGAAWIDYFAALDDGSGAMKPGMSSDGVHPTAAGYAVMEKVLAPALARLD